MDPDRTVSERLAVVETKVDAMEAEMKQMRQESRTSFDGINGRLLGFALSVAGSGVVIAATVFFTR